MGFVPTEITSKERPKVIICDDHFAIRAGLKILLEEENILVASTCDSIELLRQAVTSNPEAVVITDLNVSEIHFPELIKILKTLNNNVSVVVFSMREAPATIALCYDTGAKAFVPKSSDPAEIIQAIHLAAKGERYLPPEVAKMLANFHIDHGSPKAVLSPRELEIFISYAKSGRVEVVASEMHVSEKTAQNLLSMISKKIELPRSTFGNLARRYGLIEQE